MNRDIILLFVANEHLQCLLHWLFFMLFVTCQIYVFVCLGTPSAKFTEIDLVFFRGPVAAETAAALSEYLYLEFI